MNWVQLSVATLVFVSAIRAADVATASFKKDILPVLVKYCYKCHGDGQKKGDIALDKFQTRDDVHRDYRTWEQLYKVVSAGEMPPEERKKQPSETERKFVTDWARHALDAFYKNAPPDPGRVTVRRLNRTEYDYVIRDLMLVDFKPAKDFPADDSGHGFDNIGDVLTVSPLLFEKYLTAAEKVASQAVVLPERGNELGPNQATDFQKRYFRYPIPRHLRRRAAETFARSFMRRAYRREVTDLEVNRLMLLVKKGADERGAFEDGVRLAVMAVLISPHFMFRWELDGASGNPGEIRSLNEYELASRLAFFLWRSMPDDRLLNLARSGELRKNIDNEIRRMLQDQRVDGLVEDFAGQWLELRNLDVYRPDKKLFPSYTAGLRKDMRQETEMLYAHVINNNLSIKELLTADYTFLNERLAAHYQIKDVKGRQFRMVSLKGTQRGGIFGHASILTITSDPNRTSPVKRGKYVLENILGTPPPPPPPNVPELKVAQNGGGTLREQMIKHRSNAVCASCHRKMDPIGFAFEHFDAIGRFRLIDGGKEIDASGKLDSGEAFESHGDLQRIIAGKKTELFLRCLTKKMLVYALGRGLEYYDEKAVERIVQRLKQNGYRHNELIKGVVKSLPFDMKRGELAR